MKKNHEQFGSGTTHPNPEAQPAGPRTALWLGITAGLATLAWMSAKPFERQTRRRADRGQERRNPLHFFLAGSYPRRRAIDRSGARPWFERRESVYDSY